MCMHSFYIYTLIAACNSFNNVELYVPVFDLMGTITEIHFLPVDESHTHVLSRNTKQLRLDGQVCFFQRVFADTVKLRGWIS